MYKVSRPNCMDSMVAVSPMFVQRGDNQSSTFSALNNKVSVEIAVKKVAESVNCNQPASVEINANAFN